MLDEIVLKEKQKSGYSVCKLFIYGFGLLLLTRLAFCGVNIVATALKPASKVEVQDTGYSYRADDTILGYMQYTYDVPTEGLESPKAFIIVFLLMGILAETGPQLILVIYMLRLIKEVESSYSPFVESVIKKMKIIGGLLVGIGLLSKVVQSAV